MTIDILTTAAGVIVSIIFSILPALKVKFDTLTENQKRLVMIGLMVVVALAAYGLSCAGYLAKLFPAVKLTCDEKGLWSLVELFALALGGNQGIFMLGKLAAKTQTQT